MAQKQANPDKLPKKVMRHEMPLTHFWLSFGTSLTDRNAKFAEYISRRIEDDTDCALAMIGSKDPMSAMSRLMANRQRAFADTSALVGSMMLLPMEIGSEVAELADEEGKLMASNTKAEKVFDEVPV